MNPLLIAGIVVLAIVVVALVLTAPLMKKNEQAAVARAKELAGGDGAIRLVEPRAVGFGTEPEEAGGLRGMGVLAASADTLVFVTWRPQREHVVRRAAITAVATPTPNIGDANKAMVELTLDESGETVTASYRVPDPIEWLDELGYDWGPDGPPSPDGD